MSAVLIAETTQVLVFVLGCALIYAKREHAAVMTRWLTAATSIAAALLVTKAAANITPGDLAQFDEITVYAVQVFAAANESPLVLTFSR